MVLCESSEKIKFVTLCWENETYKVAFKEILMDFGKYTFLQ